MRISSYAFGLIGLLWIVHPADLLAAGYCVYVTSPLGPVRTYKLKTLGEEALTEVSSRYACSVSAEVRASPDSSPLKVERKLLCHSKEDPKIKMEAKLSCEYVGFHGGSVTAENSASLKIGSGSVRLQCTNSLPSPLTKFPGPSVLQGSKWKVVGSILEESEFYSSDQVEAWKAEAALFTKAEIDFTHDQKAGEDVLRFSGRHCRWRSVSSQAAVGYPDNSPPPKYPRFPKECGKPKKVKEYISFGEYECEPPFKSYSLPSMAAQLDGRTVLLFGEGSFVCLKKMVPSAKNHAALK